MSTVISPIPSSTQETFSIPDTSSSPVLIWTSVPLFTMPGTIISTGPETTLAAHASTTVVHRNALLTSRTQTPTVIPLHVAASESTALSSLPMSLARTRSNTDSDSTSVVLGPEPTITISDDESSSMQATPAIIGTAAGVTLLLLVSVALCFAVVVFMRRRRRKPPDLWIEPGGASSQVVSNRTAMEGVESISLRENPHIYANPSFRAKTPLQSRGVRTNLGAVEYPEDGHSSMLDSNMDEGSEGGPAEYAGLDGHVYDYPTFPVVSVDEDGTVPDAAIYVETEVDTAAVGSSDGDVMYEDPDLHRRLKYDDDIHAIHNISYQGRLVADEEQVNSAT